LTVKWRYFDALYGFRIEAIHVDTDAVRMRARDVERLYATVSAKIMLRDASVERIGAQHIFTLKQSKVIGGHEQVQKARLAANTAITVGCVDGRWSIDFESNPAAVTTPFVRSH
jgi:hypothetical protein